MMFKKCNLMKKLTTTTLALVCLGILTPGSVYGMKEEINTEEDLNWEINVGHSSIPKRIRTEEKTGHAGVFTFTNEKIQVTNIEIKCKSESSFLKNIDINDLGEDVMIHASYAQDKAEEYLNVHNEVLKYADCGMGGYLSKKGKEKEFLEICLNYKLIPGSIVNLIFKELQWENSLLQGNDFKIKQHLLRTNRSEEDTNVSPL